LDYSFFFCWILVALLFIGILTDTGDFIILLGSTLILRIGTGITWLIYKRKRHIIPFVEQELLKLGFSVKAERPLTLREAFDQSYINVSFWTRLGLFMERVQFKTKYNRVFTVFANDKNAFVLNTLVTFSWSNEVELTVRSKTLIQG
jgi:hypothetical protein